MKGFFLKHLWLKLYLGLFLIGILVIFCLNTLPDRFMRVWFLNVGQGDAIFIQTPEQQTILIDGGPHEKVVKKIDEILPFFRHEIDLVILSHPHADHINGLIEVLKRYKVKSILMTGIHSDYGGYLRFLDLAYEKNIPIFFVKDSTDFQLGNVFLDILYPFTSIQGQKFHNLNNTSMVFRLILGKQKILFSGDLEQQKEHELAHKDLNLAANILKVGHHGSKTSSTEIFLEHIKPHTAVISCGKNNKFNHPAPVTIDNLQKKKITIYRTDIDGTIQLLADGHKVLQIKTDH